jgi:hypothetical protein
MSKGVAIPYPNLTNGGIGSNLNLLALRVTTFETKGLKLLPSPQPGDVFLASRDYKSSHLAPHSAKPFKSTET